MVNYMHVTGELPEVSYHSLRSGMTLVEVPSNRRMIDMNKKDSSPLDGFILNELVADIEHAMARCRAMIVPSPEPGFADKCFVNLAYALHDVNSEIERRSAE